MITIWLVISIQIRGVAQLGSVLAWGARGRRFKSGRPDRIIRPIIYKRDTRLTMELKSYNNILILTLYLSIFTYSFVSNIFVGYFIWNQFGLLLFAILSLINIPICYYLRCFNYKFLFDFLDKKFSYEEALSKINILDLSLFFFCIALSIVLYDVSFGSLFIQVWKLFFHQIGLSYLTSLRFSLFLVRVSIFPDSILYAINLHVKFKECIAKLGGKHSYEIANLLNKIFLLAASFIVSLLFAQIDYSQTINSYQHYLIEFSDLLLPVVPLLTQIILMMSLLYNYIILTYSSLVYVISPGGSEKKSIFYNGLFYLFIFLFLMRSAFRSIVSAELSTNPWQFSARHASFFAAFLNDFDSFKEVVVDNKILDMKIKCLLTLKILSLFVVPLYAFSISTLYGVIVLLTLLCYLLTSSTNFSLSNISLAVCSNIFNDLSDLFISRECYDSNTMIVKQQATNNKNDR